MLRFHEFSAFSRKFGFSWTRFGRLSALSVAVVVFESVAVAMLMPIMLFIERRGDIASMRNESRAVSALFSAFDWVGVAPGFAKLLVIAFVATVLRQILTYQRLVEAVRVLEGFLRDIRHGLFTRFNDAQLEFQERLKIGEFVNAVVVESRRTAIGITTFIDLAVHVLMLVVYFGMLVTLSPLLTAVVVALMLGVGFGMRGLMQRTVEESRLVTSGNTAMTAFLNERLTTPRLIRLCRMEQAEASDFKGFVSRQEKTQVDIRKTTGIGEVIIEPVVAGTGFVLIFVAYESFGMPLASISVFLFILLRLLPLAKGVITTRQSILAGIGSLEITGRLAAKLDQAREGQGGLQDCRTICSEIVFDNVTFNYPESARPALSNVSVRLKRGTITALVGPSGGGKSTLVDLLPRLREPQSGTVSIDGVPLQEFNLSSLRGCIAYAPQVPQFFDVTVDQHIRYGRADTSDEVVRRAASLAGVSDFVSRLPAGYQTQMGQAAVHLSGGQKQRIDLARVLASEAPLVIFDEPTSNLDNESEAVFRQTLKTLREEAVKTVVVIAHRLRLVKWADQIVVLKDGRVDAAGTHDEVMATSSWYREAYLREASADALVELEPTRIVA